MRTYTIKAGANISWPRHFPSIISLPAFKGAKWHVIFPESAIYQNPNNYKGWNKGGGWILSWFRNSRENHLWAWRWDNDLQVFQLTAYSNRPDQPNGRSVGCPDKGEVMLAAKPYDKVEITMQTAKGRAVNYTFRNLRSGAENSCVHYTRIGKLFAYWSFLWFGGIYKAPKQIELKMKRAKL